MARPTTILFVDDEPLLRELFSIWLTRQGYRVLTAASGEDAITILNSEEPVNILLADYHLPGINGPQLIEQARGKPSILLSSGLEEVAPEEMQRLNITAVISKPIQRDLMLEALDQASTSSGAPPSQR